MRMDITWIEFEQFEVTQFRSFIVASTNVDRGQPQQGVAIIGLAAQHLLVFASGAVEFAALKCRER